MAITINGFTITSLETIHAYNRVTGAPELYLDELQETTIENSEDTQDITGKGDRLLKQIKKNKAVTVTGTSALISGDLLAAQTGSSPNYSAATIVRKPEIISVAKDATTATTSFTAIGEVGAEILSLRLVEANGALGQAYEQGTEASATKFTYDPSTKTITLPTGITSEGDITIAVFYDYQTPGTTVANLSDVYGKTLKVYIDCIGTDVCDNEYKCQFIIPRGQFSGEFSISMGGDQTVQNFTINTLVDVCAGTMNGTLFDFIVYDDSGNTALNTYSVTLNANGGSITEGHNVTSYTEGTGATLPDATYVTKSSYDFAGWYDNGALTGEAVTEIPATATGNKSYYAKWVEQ